MTRTKKWKIPLLIFLSVVAGLLVLAIVVGVLNALVGGGEWTFGWNTYRYDNTDYTVGSGTVYAECLKGLDIDWIDGAVEIVVCEDAYPSVSERVPTDTGEENLLRFCVIDGVLTVKYRAPTAFLGFNVESKDLTVRIPKRMLSELETLTLNVVSSDVSVEAIPFSSVSVNGVSGQVLLGVDEGTEKVSVKTVGGDVTLSFEENPSFALEYTTVGGGAPLLDFVHEQREGSYVCGGGNIEISVETVGGELAVKKKN